MDDDYYMNAAVTRNLLLVMEITNNLNNLTSTLRRAFENFRDKLCVNGKKDHRRKFQAQLIARFIEDNENIITELSSTTVAYPLSVKCYEHAVRLFTGIEVSGKDGIYYASKFSELIENLLFQILTLEININNQNFQMQLDKLLNDMEMDYGELPSLESKGIWNWMKDFYLIRKRFFALMKAFIHGSSAKVFFVLLKHPIVDIQDSHVFFHGLPVLFSLQDTNPDIIPARDLPESVELAAARLEAENVLEHSNIGLFRLHSNLLSSQVDVRDGCCVIKLTVPCKGFIPCCDRNSLPSRLGKFKTWICSGWVDLCGRYECNTQQPFRFGSSVCPRPLSLYVPTGSLVPSCSLGSFGTFGGCIQYGTQLYGVTAGHVFLISEEKEVVGDKERFDGAGATTNKLVRTMFPPGTEVVHGCAMSNFLQLLRSEHCEGDFEFVQRVAEDPILKMLQRLEYPVESINEVFPVVGAFVGGVCGKIGDQCGDVAVFAISSATVITTDYMKVVTDLEGQKIAFPSYILDITPEEIDAIEGLEEIRCCTDDILVFGQGANSESPSKVLVQSQKKILYLRGWFPQQALGRESNCNDPIYTCIYGISQDMNWNAGDSGTWFWRQDTEGTKRFVGMGIGKDKIGGCVILPMKTVFAIARLIIVNSK